MQERVQKFISESGVASRRKAEEFIKSGQVSINGRRAKLGDKVDPTKDEVTVYGQLVQPVTQKLYIAINKPRNTVVSKRDPQGRKTIFSFLPDELRSKVHNIGRLDFETEGLLILTNDGDLTEKLAHPRYEHEKEYEVITDAEPKPVQLEKLKNGVDLPTGLTREAKVKIRSGKIYITIHEGKKRQVRRMFNSVGLGVRNLKRVRINKYTMPADLAPGEFVQITRSDIL